METRELNNLFTHIRANAGDQMARHDINRKDYDVFDLQIESLSMSLQMQFSRLQGTTLHKIRSRSIAQELRNIIEDGLSSLILRYLKSETFLSRQLKSAFSQNEQDMDIRAREIYSSMRNLNLSHDFNKISYKIQDLHYDDIIRILKNLIITAIIRRSKRRKFISTPNF